jgi:tyrosine-protein kinase Etk/Wzc
MNDSINSNQYTPEQSDFKKTINLFLSKWYWFPISILFAMIVVRTINEMTTPIYKVGCNIVIGDDLTDQLTGNQIKPTGIDFNRVNPINKEIGIIKSKNLAEKTIDSLNLSYQCYELKKGGKYFRRRLYNDIPFKIIVDSSDFFETDREIILKIIDAKTVEISINSDYDITRRLKIGEKFTYKRFSFGLGVSKGYTDFSDYINKRYSFTFKSKYSLASEYADKLKVETDPVSQNILKLSMTDENLYQSIDYLNKLCELYIKNDINIRNVIATKTIGYIDLQLGILSEQLNDAEDSLIDFKRKNNVLLSEENTPLVQNYYQFEKDVDELTYQEKSLQSLQKFADSLKINKNVIIPKIISLNERMSGQLEQVNSLIVQREILLKNQSKSSPEVKLINQQIDVNASVLKEYLGKELKIVNNQKGELLNRLKTTEAELQSLPESQRKRITFEREFKLAENIYNIYQQKRIEAILAKESTVSKIRVLDPARYEDHMMVSPRKNYNFRIALILSLLLPGFLIILFKNLSDRIDDINEIKSRTRSIILGKIYHADLTSELPIFDFPQSAIAESFYKLFTRLKFMKPEPGIKVISITSGASGEGKTFCAANLASAIALSGKKVVLLSLDLRRPKIHDIFSTEIAPGITDYLLNKAEKNEIIVNTGITNLDIIPSGPIPPDPITLISQNKLAELFKELSLAYDYVIVDTPPVGMVADAMLIGKLSDLTLMLVRIRFTRKVIFDLIDELQESNNIENMALVVNDIKAYSSYSGNGYYKYYHVKEKQRFWKRR